MGRASLIILSLAPISRNELKIYTFKSLLRDVVLLMMVRPERLADA